MTCRQTSCSLGEIASERGDVAELYCGPGDDGVNGREGWIAGNAGS